MELPCTVASKQIQCVSFMIKSPKGVLSPYMNQNVYFTKFQALLQFGILLRGGGELNIRLFRI